MKTSMKFILLTGVACLTVGLIGTAAAWKNMDWKSGITLIEQEKTIPAGDVSRFSLESDIANVIFIPGETDEIKVYLKGAVSEERAKEVAIVANKNGSDSWNVSVRTEPKFRFGFDLGDLKALLAEQDNRLRAEVTLPNKVYRELKVHSNVGSIELAHVQADTLIAHTDTGSITLEQFEGKELELHSDTGRIEVREAAGDVKAQTDTGSISIGRLSGALADIETSTGSVEIEEAQGDIRLRTDTGRIQAGLTEAVSNVEAESSTGSIELDFTKAPESASFHLSSDVGRVTLSVPGAEIEEQERGFIKGVVGNGRGATVKAESDTGSVKIK